MSAAQGIDISKWQGTIDWAAVARSTIDFAIIKATEGTTYKDPRYYANVTAARAAGVIVGTYHYFHFSYDPEDQAENFYRAVGPLRNGDIIPWLDVEVLAAVEGSERINLADCIQALAMCVVYCERRFKSRVGIYTSPGFWAQFTATQRNRFSTVPLWVANWTGVGGSTTLPGGWKTYQVHQFTSSGRVAGISGNVDLDFSADIEAVRHYIDPPDDDWKAKASVKLAAIRAQVAELEAIIRGA